jgi:hypothetical protein
MTSCRVSQASGIATARVVLGGTDPDEVSAVGWQLTASETIAAVRGQWQASVQARASLSRGKLRAGCSGARNDATWFVDTVGIPAWGVRRCDGKRIALLTPIAPILAGPGLLRNKVTSLFAGPSALPWNAAVEGVLGVVAWSGAVGIVRIDQAVPVVVEAIATLIDLALAGCDVTAVARPAAPASSAAGGQVRATARDRARRRDGSASHGSNAVGEIAAHFDAFRTIRDEQASAQAHRYTHRSEFWHVLIVSLWGSVFDHAQVSGSGERFAKRRCAAICFGSSVEPS